jgi:hypothetical protein
MKMLSVLLVTLALAAPTLAQEAPRATTPAMAYTTVPDTPQAAPPAPAERRPLPTRNVKVDVTITEQNGTEAPVKKIVSLLVADGRSSSVRTITAVPTYTGNMRDLPLNIDANVTVTPEQRVLLDLRFNYSSIGIMEPVLPKGFTPKNEDERVASGSRPSLVAIVENLTALLTPGTPVAVARSADPATDRIVTVEVKAEILR